MNQDQITRIEKIKAVLDAIQEPGAMISINHRTPTKIGDGHSALTQVVASIERGYTVEVLLPSQPTKQSVTAKDWDDQTLVWLRHIRDGEHHLVVSITTKTFDASGYDAPFWFEDQKEFIAYSFDRKIWHPFTKEVPGEMVIAATTE